MIYYLTHVNYNPGAADLTSIGVTIAPTVEGGGGRRAGTGWEAGRYGEGGGPVRGGRRAGMGREECRYLHMGGRN
jgi:hypothetical protein